MNFNDEEKILGSFVSLYLDSLDGSVDQICRPEEVTPPSKRGGGQGIFKSHPCKEPGRSFRNPGGEKGGLSSSLFVLVSLIAIGVIIFFLFKTRDDEKILSLAFSMVLSGAIGNLIDRFRYGEVIDFFDFQLFSFHWPAFNIADSAITIGIGLKQKVAWELLLYKKDQVRKGNLVR